ncbi:phage protease [Rheinheimera baltica]|uniref:phage protease n=1 Tax=Rheinheimera baltica TaxID=67576 RepID=UPI0004298300|nr:phage protease [Rheinheimera baltica]
MFKTSTTSLAVLTAIAQANQGLGVAVLSEQIDTTDGWVQLLPDGDFSSIDGRPHDVPGGKWKMNAEIAERLISQVQLRANELPIDYEHQTLKAADNGKPAPAAGWFKEMQYRAGKGLFVKPTWVADAKQRIINREYRYLSAVFPYDRTTGEPLAINMAALTNYPGLDGMQALASLAAQFGTAGNDSPTTNPREKAMNELLKKLLSRLGIVIDDGTEPTEQNINDAIAALTAMDTGKDKVAALTAEIAALKADTGNIDHSKYVPVDVYHALHAELASLKANNDVLTVDQVIEQAQNDGKLIVPAELSYLKSLGKQSLAALKASLDSRPVVAALMGKQTKGKAPDDVNKPTVAALTADQKTVADQLGISYDDMAKDLGA